MEGDMATGLSIANNVLANSVQYNLNNNQSALKNIVTQLSSGLRINSAADDPSGLAIATNLQTQVDGFTAAVQNVQNANNAAQVALGALTTTTDILQRIRSLAVEASSDLNSSQDRQNLQAEVNQLLLEVNSISQSVNFNGQPLLDGSHAGFQPEQIATATITANTALSGGGGAIAGAGSTPGTAAVVTNGSFTNPAIPANSEIPAPAIPGWTLSGGFVLINGNDGVDPTVPAGSQALGGFTSGASAQTTITGLIAGATYSVGYAAATGTPGSAHVQVLANGTDITSGAGLFLTNSYTSLTTNTFVANAAGTVTLAFNNIQTGGNSQFTNVGLNLVSAPAGSGTSGTTIDPNFLVAGVTAANANFNTTVGAVSTYAAVAGGTYATLDGSIELQVINTGVSIAVQETFINSATGAVSVDSTLFGSGSTNNDFDNLSVTTGNFGALDVGTTAFIKIGQNVAALTNPNNPAFNFQSGANEGDTIQIGIQATNTQTLRISNINLAISAANNPSIGSEDAIGQIDQALNTILNQQALLGAVVVRLNEDANNDNVAAVNLQASESSIRDLNVGQATTQFTKLQVLVQVGTSVLAQSNTNAQSVLGLFR